MKKKTLIGILVVIILFLISFFIPVKSEEILINDDEIAEVGHYEIHYYNIYGITIKTN